MPIKSCEFCRKSFYVKPSHFNNRRTCSLQCLRMLDQERWVPNEDRAVEMYQKGYGLKRIGHILAWKWSSVRNVLIKNGVTIRPVGAQITTNETPLSLPERQMLEGNLLGDGGLIRSGPGRTSYFNLTTTHDDYATHISALLPFENGICESPEKTYLRNGKLSHHKKRYQLWTAVDLTLNFFYDAWYPRDKKVVPADLELAPTTVKYWFYDDGSTTYGASNNVSLTLCTEGFTYNECERLCQMLLVATGARFTPYRDSKNAETYSIRCSAMLDVRKFFKYIGECDVPSFEYKWKLPPVPHTSLRVTNTSGVTGVSRAHGRMWQANMRINGRSTYLGEFKNKKDAIRARKRAEKQCQNYSHAS